MCMLNAKYKSNMGFDACITIHQPVVQGKYNELGPVAG